MDIGCFLVYRKLFFPIPPDILLIPMILATPATAYRDAAVCTVSSVLGGFFGYLIGMFLYDAVAVPVFTFYNYMEQLEAFKGYYNSYGAWVVAMAGFTPFPYKVITITSGMTGLDLGVFTIASVLSRGGRFFLLAFLLKNGANRCGRFWKRIWDGLQRSFLFFYSAALWRLRLFKR